jgi:hypothetical protein
MNRPKSRWSITGTVAAASDAAQRHGRTEPPPVASWVLDPVGAGWVGPDPINLFGDMVDFCNRPYKL